MNLALLHGKRVICSHRTQPKWHDSTVLPLQKLAAVGWHIFQPVSSEDPQAKARWISPCFAPESVPPVAKYLLSDINPSLGWQGVQPWRVKESQCPPENSRGQYIIVQDHVQELKEFWGENQGHSKEKSFMAFQSPNKKSKGSWEQNIEKKGDKTLLQYFTREDLQISTWKHAPSLWLGKSKLKPQEGLPWWSRG